MADFVKGKELAGEEVKSHRIRITLTSRNVEALEKGELPPRRGPGVPGMLRIGGAEASWHRPFSRHARPPVGKRPA